jgi:CRP/FNR family transcriptional regulator, cyclic AMP receptor protein
VSLGDDQLKRLRRAGELKTYQPGQLIFTQGEPSEFAIIIDDGLVKVVRNAANGVPTELTKRRAGDLIGEFGCIDRAPRSASVIAVTQVTAFMIPAAKLRTILLAESHLLYNLLAITISRVRESDRLRLEFGTESGVEQVFRTLLTFAEQAGEPGERSVRLRIDQDELAREAGVSRSTVGRAYGQLKDHELIATGLRQVEVLDLDRLRAFVFGERS